MLNTRAVTIGLLSCAGIVLVGTGLFAAKEQPPAEAAELYQLREPVRLVPPHWSDTHLRSLSAESNVEQSIYLSAVQLTELERTQGDVTKAEPYLEQLAQRAPTQPLKNAVRRLLVDIALERRDYKAAEKHLKTIIDESLSQF